ncbi:MAG: carbohydrate ABC transporter permease [Pseudomonadales bacterium]
MLTPWIVVGFSWRLMLDLDLGPLAAALQMLGFTPDLNSAGWAWFTIIVMDVWHWTGLVIVLTYAGYLSIPVSYFHAALIDGANSWRTFRYVELPTLRRVLIIAFLLRLMDSFMVYIEPFMVTRGGPDISTTFLSLDLIQTASVQFDLGKAGAMSVIYLLIMISICWVLFQSIHAQKRELGVNS